MLVRIRLLFMFLFIVTNLLCLKAQPPRQMVEVEVYPQQQKFDYSLGEQVHFHVVVKVSGIPVEATGTYTISEDMMEPLKQGSLKLVGGKGFIEGVTMNKSGFLRCEVEAIYNHCRYKGLCTVGFEPEKLLPTVDMPTDFNAFWEAQLEEAARVPMSPRLQLMAGACTEKVNVYHLSIGAFASNSRIYGVLCVPKEEGKYPAILKVPGAGIRPYQGDVATAENGYITLELGIHGIPVNLPQTVYDALANGALNGYPTMNIDSRTDFYYRRVYLSCVRAVDYLAGLPQFDGTNLFVMGGSQGGALSIVTAALNPKVKAIMAFYLALCDLTGYLHGRAGGWPHYFRNRGGDSALEAKVSTAAYYDVANFAKRLNVPSFISFGYNDMVCPPTTTYSTYNVIPSEKLLFVVEETGHYNYPEQWNKGWDWVMRFKNKK